MDTVTIAFYFFEEWAFDFLFAKYLRALVGVCLNIHIMDIHHYDHGQKLELRFLLWGGG